MGDGDFGAAFEPGVRCRDAPVVVAIAAVSGAAGVPAVVNRGGDLAA